MHLWKLRLYFLPILIFAAIICERADLLHIAYVHIKSYELKWTELSMDYYPKTGDLFTAGEIVSQNNYEDAVLAFNPDYNRLLDEDLSEIAANRDLIDRIDDEELAFYSGPYKIQACLDKK